MNHEFTKLHGLVAKDMLPPTLLTHVLLYHSRHDPDALGRLLESAKAATLGEASDVLELYPLTDYGWSLLPSRQSAHLQSGLSRSELADLDKSFFQDDRPYVESLRLALACHQHKIAALPTSSYELAASLKSEAVSNMALANHLLSWIPEASQDVASFISTLSLERLRCLRDTLSVYPETDVGWNILPDRPELLPTLTELEATDVAKLRFQADRGRVESLRRLVLEAFANPAV